MRVSIGGASIKSKDSKSLMPIAWAEGVEKRQVTAQKLAVDTKLQPEIYKHQNLTLTSTDWTPMERVEAESNLLKSFSSGWLAKSEKYPPSGRVLYWLNLFSGSQARWLLAFHLDKHALCTAYSISQVLFSQLFLLAALLEPKGKKGMSVNRCKQVLLKNAKYSNYSPFYL